LKKFWLVIGVIFVIGTSFLLWQFLKPEPPKGPHFLFKILGDSKSNFERPLAATTQGDKIFVVDSGRRQTQVFDKWGEFLFSFPAKSAKDEALSYPAGIVVGRKKEIYVSDLKRGRILVFNSRGKYLTDFPKDTSLIKKPLALAFALNKLYVTDVGDQSVKIFDLKGKLVRKFGKTGKKQGQFSYPNGIAVSKKGFIFVSDSNNKRIQVFDQLGKFEYIIGRRVLTLPRGIVIDQFNRIHVADTLAFKVAVFKMKGDYLFSYQEPQTDVTFPQGLAINAESRRIYVTDRLNGWVSVWEY